MRFKNFLNEANSIKDVSYSYIKDKLDSIDDLPKQKYSTKFKYYIIEIESTIAGICVFDENPEDNYKLFGLNKEQLGHDMEILFFWVDSSYRNQHIGSDLLRFVTSKYKKFYIGLGTGRMTSDAAHHLYQKFGFKVVVSVNVFRWYLKKSW